MLQQKLLQYAITETIQRKEALRKLKEDLEPISDLGSSTPSVHECRPEVSFAPAPPQWGLSRYKMIVEELNALFDDEDFGTGIWSKIHAIRRADYRFWNNREQAAENETDALNELIDQTIDLLEITEKSLQIKASKLAHGQVNSHHLVGRKIPPNPTVGYLVAFSYASEYREFISSVVGELKRLGLTHGEIFFDEDAKHHCNRPSADEVFRKVFLPADTLKCVFFSQAYEKKQWCLTEWDSIKQTKVTHPGSIALFNFEHNFWPQSLNKLDPCEPVDIKKLGEASRVAEMIYLRVHQRE